MRSGEIRSNLDVSGPDSRGTLVRGIGGAFIDVFFVCSALLLFLLLNSIHHSISLLSSAASLSSPPCRGVKPAQPRRRAFFVFFIIVSSQLGEKQGIQKGSDDRVQVPGYLDPGGCTKHRIDIGMSSGRQRLESSF
jgi:hypothetical protein